MTIQNQVVVAVKDLIDLKINFTNLRQANVPLNLPKNLSLKILDNTKIKEINSNSLTMRKIRMCSSISNTTITIKKKTIYPMINFLN
jgi:hypothetical protein